MLQPFEKSWHREIGQVGNVETIFVTFQLIFGFGLLLPIKRGCDTDQDDVLGIRLKSQGGIECGRWRHITFDAGKVRVKVKPPMQPVGKTKNNWHAPKISVMSFEHELQRRGPNSDDDIGSMVLILPNVEITKSLLIGRIWRSEERRVGKECRSRWS